MNPTDDRAAPELKHIFDRGRIRAIAQAMQAVHPAFDADAFVHRCDAGLDDLSLMQRLGRVTEALHAGLPPQYEETLPLLQALAPRLDHSFVTLVLPEYVARHGLHAPALSLEALRFFTPYGTAEFAVRHYLRQDLAGTLAVMRQWAEDADPHVRRLASEGARPRLPWSFRLAPLIANPRPVLPILERLKADPSPYVRKSVANHFNDITKDHPALVLDLFERWPREDVRTQWIVRHALRTLIKRGDARALALVGANAHARVEVGALQVTPDRVPRGGSVRLQCAIVSTAAVAQTLVIDYAVHYVKRTGATTPKVFKWKTLQLPAGGRLHLDRHHALRDLSTRRHHPGRHRIELMVNGVVRAEASFELEA